MRRAATSAAVLAVAAVTAGCGSTVQLGRNGSASVANSVGGNGGLSLPGQPAGATGAGAALGPGGAVAPGSAPGSTGVATTGGQLGSSSTTGAARPIGVTATTINVGIPYSPGTGQQLAAAGFGALAGGDTRDYFNLVINDTNQHGGIDGLKIHPIFHTFDSNPNKTQAQGDQEECSDYTQDHKVYATFLSGGDDTSRQCLTHGGVSVMLTENLTTSTATVFQRYPNYVELSTLDYDNAAAPWVGALVRQGYFTGWDPTTGTASSARPAKIGVITSDQPDIKRATRESLLPALARAGHPVDPNLVAYITFPQTTNDDATVVNDVQAAELKFFQSGVTHVIINDYAGGFTAFFTRDASNQGYHPRYGLSTQSGAETLKSEGLIPAGQLNGAKGFGWDPSLDLQASDNPDSGPYSNATRRKCLALFKQHGVTFSGPTAEGQALAICDMVWALRAILTAGGPKVTVNSFAIGIRAVGRTFAAASTMGTYLSPDHRAAVGVGADWSYVSGCDCMRYVSKPYQVGS